MKRRPNVVEYVIGATPYGAPVIARHYVYQENGRKKKKVLDVKRKTKL